jgi:hypothetical protein
MLVVSVLVVGLTDTRTLTVAESPFVSWSVTLGGLRHIPGYVIADGPAAPGIPKQLRKLLFRQKVDFVEPIA